MLKISDEIFKSFLLCPHKAFLLSRGESGIKSEYEAALSAKKEKYCAEAVRALDIAEASFINVQSAVVEKKGIYYRTNIESSGMSSACVVESVKGESSLGAFHFVPVIFSADKKLPREGRMELAYDGLVLESLQTRRPEFGWLIHGNKFKATRLRIGDQIAKARKVVDSIKKHGSNSPRIMLNRHCHVCEFASACRAKAIEKDDLSLLVGISPKEIEAQNKKGIFTVTQYSYTFRPRKKFRKAPPLNLRALALREQKIHLYGTPALPTASVQVYLDVEGDPERNCYYLIGVVIIENGIEKRQSFWADSEIEEGAACLAFVSCVRDYKDYKLYHYGSYETKFLKKVRFYACDTDDIRAVESMIENAVNVLTIVYKHVFFPTYSNGLKDVGAYLGFKWASEGASGITSLVWRARFEETRDDIFKKRLIEYNLDDCVALRRVTEFVGQIIKDVADGGLSHVDYIQADALKVKSSFRWGTIDFELKDMKYINDCAYFDYQRERVFFRTNDNLRGVKATRKAKKKRPHKINKKIMLLCQMECLECKKKMYRHGHYSRRVFDLKFLTAGMKKWVTVYYASRARCARCEKVICAEYPEDLQKYGHNLISWVIYQHIVGHLPFHRILSMLDDLFGFSVGGSTMQRFKKIAAEYYQEAYQGIIDKIKRGILIHVDETQVSFPGVSGYVWVFTNMEDVFFLYTPTREGDFLREMLADFKGVVISDFYGAYCYPDWIQQKCLVHLIRDLNDDLRSAPFDEEFKKIAEDFTVLLRPVIDTIDKFGLKRRHLAKHKKDVVCFFRNIGGQDFHSELAQKYQKRFLKNENTLFTFLDYDGVPWNNNNAEHAIKHFAIYRQTMRASGRITERGLKQYLVLLSVFQTCRYQGINFMEFLVSKEKDVDHFSQRRSRKDLFLPVPLSV